MRSRRPDPRPALARLFLVLVGLVLPGLILAGCTGRSGTPAEPPGGKAARSLAPLPGGEPRLDQAIVDAGNPRTVARPLAAYQPGSETSRILTRARLIVGDRCMRRYGFTPDPAWVPETAPRLDWSRYGLWDAEVAAVRGYDSPPIENSGNTQPLRYVAPDSVNVYLGNVKELNGQPVPLNGCQGEEYRALLPSTPSHFDPRALEKLDQESVERATVDSRVTALITAWRDCVRNAGWTYQDPKAPFGYWSTRRGTDKNRPVVSDTEKRAARADLDCKKSTRLLGTWLAADIAYQRAIIEREGPRLREYAQVMDTMLGNANRIIANG